MVANVNGAAKKSAFIEDGYTESAYIAPVPRLFDDPVRFEFRPALAEERAKIMRAIHTASAKDPAKGEIVQAHEIAKRITKWSIQHNGADVKITGGNILRLRYALIDRLSAIVLFGSEGGDADPELTNSELDEFAEAEYESALSGGSTTFAEAREEQNEKN